ncbi:MAG: type ISP restriction/modification enzyme [Bacteroidales bacterium]
MILTEYIDKVNARYRSGISTEHSYRSDLLSLIESLVPGIVITNEPKRVACGAPDYIITRRNIPVGYIEAKDIGADLNSKKYKEQFDRYKQSLDNLIITDYLTFQFFVNGSATTSITIGEISGNKIHPIPDNFERFTDLIKDFCEYVGQTIKSAQKLSKMMAAKAKLLANVIELALDPDKEAGGVNELQNINLLSQFESFKQVLIHDITPKAFADIYAQTIAYGMFAARLNDPSLENFTRQEAAELIPRSNPFLRKLFQYIAGYDLDDRIVWIVDALADIFKATNVEEMLKDFGKATHQTDPFIHFYETFLAEYDPKLRKSRGVWYTPEPVVNFIVRAVDDILKTEFGLSQGLVDTSKIKIKVPGQEKKPIEKEIHKVQILDPAAGTGTFLAEVIKQIHTKFEGQQGIWSKYVEDHLIPRLYGFEILMASYTMAHLKLEMLLRDSGYASTRDQRLRVYLTNSLEENHPDTGTLFANWLSSEANEANHIKRDTPVMIVLGNPPYSGISTNKGTWIINLIEDYKYLDGVHFGEKKHWLQDDYVKFLRFGEYLISKNGEGILAFINNHSFLDNTTFRGMRWHLLNTFNSIYSINLHGNAKKKETTEDGGRDENVFDIQQGVSINLFIKTKGKLKSSPSSLYYFDFYGLREDKYKFLYNNSIGTVPFKRLEPKKPFYFFVPKSDEGESEYLKGFKINELFPKNITGIVTMGDSFILSDNLSSLKERLNHFMSNELSETGLNEKFELGKNYSKWILSNRQSLQIDDSKFTQIDYRPFDSRWTYFDNKLIWRWRIEIMQHFLGGENIGLVIPKVNKEDNCFFISNRVIAHKLCSAYDSNSIFPLYLYQENNGLTAGQSCHKVPNINSKIINDISLKIGYQFHIDGNRYSNSFSPLDVLDFIYAILHSPTYRRNYREFLKVDFPRVPYPKDGVTFWQLVNHGSELRQIHLLESPIVDKYITAYPIIGPNEVAKLQYQDGKVWINNEQYFDNVPQVAWEFYIGGYQPAQKWLKDRKGRVLSYEDIMHYQKIIVALTETDRIMKEIDKIEFLDSLSNKIEL